MSAQITNYKVSTVDLNAIFSPYVSGTQANTTGYKVGTADLNAIFAKYVSGAQAGATGYKIGTTDLNAFFEPRNLVTNGNFTSATGWNVTPTTGTFAYAIPEPPLVSGTATTTCYRDGMVGANRRLSQYITTVPNRVYTISFWLLMGTPPTPPAEVFFSVSVDGNTLFSTSSGNTAFAKKTLTFNSNNSTSMELVFLLRQDPSYIHLTRIIIV